MNTGGGSGQRSQPPTGPETPPPPPPLQVAASPESSRRNNGPTISIENVELLEADRQHDEKRSRRGSRQQEAAAAAAAAAAIQDDGRNDAAPAPVYSGSVYGAYGQLDPNNALVGGRQQGSYYGAPPQHSQPSQDPSVPSSYFYPNYVPAPSSGQQHPHALSHRQEPHYGITYQGGYQTAGSGFYSPPSKQQAAGYGGTLFFPQQQLPPGAGGATEYSSMLGSGGNKLSSFDANYGSLGGVGPGENYQPVPQQPYPRMLASPSHDVTGVGGRGVVGALTIDDIEKSFNAVVSQQYPDPSMAPSQPKILLDNFGSRPPSFASAKDDKPRHGKAPAHRRSNSNISAGSGKHHHRRSGSTGNLPPVGPSRSPAANSIHRKKPDSVRRRSLSGTFISSNSSTGGGSHHRRPSFSRNHSSTDLQSVGGQSVTSHHSVVSDISKSALFQGVTEEGHVQLRFPYEAVRLISNKNMDSGRLYMQEIPAAQYESYHLAAEELTAWEHRLDHENRFKGLDCTCTCTNCNGCTGKRELIPPTFYALRIDEDLYRHVLDEIAAAHQTPCGLFFCGHHEDVSSPSISIAIGIIVLLFAGMGYVAFVVQS
ncbi:hypothetical protein ACA910_003080 [Epithemia clementina (nom. ined.)]